MFLFQLKPRWCVLRGPVSHLRAHSGALLPARSVRNPRSCSGRTEPGGSRSPPAPPAAAAARTARSTQLLHANTPTTPRGTEFILCLGKSPLGGGCPQRPRPRAAREPYEERRGSALSGKAALHQSSGPYAGEAGPRRGRGRCRRLSARLGQRCEEPRAARTARPASRGCLSREGAARVLCPAVLRKSPTRCLAGMR